MGDNTDLLFFLVPNVMRLYFEKYEYAFVNLITLIYWFLVPAYLFCTNLFYAYYKHLLGM